MNEQNKNSLPIGVFDSGVGGLTVLKALRARLPNEQFIYLGDTARLPYGTKSADTILNYTVQACRILIDHGIKMLIIACNTASTVSLPALKQAFPNLPILGVIEPGAKAACLATTNNRIAVLATEATVKSQAYQNAIQAINPNAEVIAYPCGLFVALAEEGWTGGEIAEKIAEKYLAPMMAIHQEKAIDCLVLGCTHFPALIEPIEKVTNNSITMIDSAKTTADEAAILLEQYQLLAIDTANHLRPVFLVTDAPARFARVAKSFLNLNIEESMIDLIHI